MRAELARATLAREALRLNRRRGSALPPLVFLTDDARTPEPMETLRSLPRGSLVIVRAKSRARRMALAEAIVATAKARELRWLVAQDAELAMLAGADGVHFPEAHLNQVFHWRAVRPRWLITCAVHSLRSCAQAARFGADAALLAPVFETESHAGAKPLGPVRVRRMAREAPIPVYALGGIDAAGARRLRNADLVGLAAIGALYKWPQ
jgi:thiamine-phosphate pyrophosphorylase